jgi:hypothetical protein
MVIVMQKDGERSADIRDVMVALMNKLEFANTEGFSSQVKKVLRSLDL